MADSSGSGGVMSGISGLLSGATDILKNPPFILELLAGGALGVAQGAGGGPVDTSDYWAARQRAHQRRQLGQLWQQLHPDKPLPPGFETAQDVMQYEQAQQPQYQADKSGNWFKLAPGQPPEHITPGGPPLAAAPQLKAPKTLSEPGLTDVQWNPQTSAWDPVTVGGEPRKRPDLGGKRQAASDGRSAKRQEQQARARVNALLAQRRTLVAKLSKSLPTAESPEESEANRQLAEIDAELGVAGEGLSAADRKRMATQLEPFGGIGRLRPVSKPGMWSKYAPAWLGGSPAQAEPSAPGAALQQPQPTPTPAPSAQPTPTPGGSPPLTPKQQQALDAAPDGTEVTLGGKKYVKRGGKLRRR